VIEELSDGEKQIYFYLSKDRKRTRATVSPIENMRAIRTRREMTRAGEASGI